MGLSASQARLIAKTAQMNDIEYQGQQINQQRTTLSNQVSALYNQLLDMQVPTPPSTVAFTRTQYSGCLGSNAFTINSVLPRGEFYHANLEFTRTGHFMDSMGEVRVDRTETGFAVDGSPLYRLADTLTTEPPLISDEAMEGYIAAIRNAFPDYANASDEEILGKFSVYFETVGTRSNAMVPHFFQNEQLYAIPAEPGSYGRIQMYDYIESGRYTEVVPYEDVKLTFDTDGRITEIALPNYDSTGTAVVSWTRCPVEAETVTDDAAYNQAFNEYEYAKTLYDRKQNEINAKTSIIQRQDKNLELKLTRLDNERNAVKTEMDAVKKVVDDNIESSYKTFSG